MIQRIQSVYLLLAALLLLAAFAFPLWTLKLADVAQPIAQLHLHETLTVKAAPGAPVPVPFTERTVFNTILSVLDILAAAGAIGIIFLYKPRQRQLRLAQFLGLLIGGLIALTFFAASSIKKPLDMASLLQEEYGAGTWLIVAALPLVFLAIRGIQSDIKKVRSADRLR